MILRRPIFALRRTSRGARESFAMLDVVYIVAGIAILGVFGLYAAGLRRI